MRGIKEGDKVKVFNDRGAFEGDGAHHQRCECGRGGRDAWLLAPAQ